ncbi:hypothetical protein HHK36_024736 [Tetracentron sinense]|uniref:Uncharacterized protein n=1 Tax=Tetracentron sinense TaxID=13715 RepID=A0A835D4D7_TETSI|nr:hypothetical protein HHK36_024736 [Tetracentron sinense]
MARRPPATFLFQFKSFHLKIKFLGFGFSYQIDFSITLENECFRIPEEVCSFLSFDSQTRIVSTSLLNLKPAFIIRSLGQKFRDFSLVDRKPFSSSVENGDSVNENSFCTTIDCEGTEDVDSGRTAGFEHVASRDPLELYRGSFAILIRASNKHNPTVQFLCEIRFKPLVVKAKTLLRDLLNVQSGDCMVAFSRRVIFEVKMAIEKYTKHSCCVIYGAWPPEIRRQQADLFNDQDNEFDVLVASDDHFLRKYIRYSAGMVQQIAGRAGQRGSRYPDGLMTTLHLYDLDYLIECLKQPFDEVKNVGLFTFSLSRLSYLPGRSKMLLSASYLKNSYVKKAETMATDIADPLSQSLAKACRTPESRQAGKQSLHRNKMVMRGQGHLLEHMKILHPVLKMSKRHEKFPQDKHPEKVPSINIIYTYQVVEGENWRKLNCTQFSYMALTPYRVSLVLCLLEVKDIGRNYHPVVEVGGYGPYGIKTECNPVIELDCHSAAVTKVNAIVVDIDGDGNFIMNVQEAHTY